MVTSCDIEAAHSQDHLKALIAQAAAEAQIKMNPRRSWGQMVLVLRGLMTTDAEYMADLLCKAESVAKRLRHTCSCAKHPENCFRHEHLMPKGL